MISNNRFSKYTLYAVGEIILVVIGILIALQINNWNESKKELAKERELLNYALETIKTDSISIDSIMRRTDRILKVHEDLIKFSMSEISKREVGDLDMVRASEPNVLITRKNNPNLPNEVMDVELKKIILDYYLGIEWLEYTITNNNTIIEDMVRPFLGNKKLLNYGSQVGTDLNSMDLINDDRFFEEFEHEELKQILFESGLKLRIMRINAERTSKKNSLLKKAIQEYLSS